MKSIQIIIKVIISILILSAAWAFVVPTLEIFVKTALSQEVQNSQLLENTCDEVKYKGIDCKLYQELAKELNNLDVPTISYQDIVCVSSAALSAQLPPLTPPFVVEVVVEKITKEKVPNCDIDKSYESVKKSLNEYQKFKSAELKASS